MRVLFFFLSVLCITIMLYCDLLEVDINGNYDYLVIQEAIEAAVDGDTILVHPGHYFENVDMMGKLIVLGSLFLTTGDRLYIANTIIDGNQTGSCVIAFDDEPLGTKLSGFTLMNGTGTEQQYGTNIFNGGGIFVWGGYLDIESCIIENNIGACGGGITIFSNSNVNLKDVTVRNNQAIYMGGGLYISNGNSEVNFDPSYRCNLYNNYGCKGSDIFIDYQGGNLDIFVDTLTVENYWGYYIYQEDDGNLGAPVWTGLSIEMENVWMEPVNSDLYVSTEGDDSNCGTNSGEPLKTISWAMNIIDADAENQHTIFLDEGVYSPETTGDKFPFQIKGGVIISGVSSENTILDGNNSTVIINTCYCVGDIGLNNLRIINCYVEEWNTPNALAQQDAISLGSYIWGDLTIENVVFENNDPVYCVLRTGIKGTQILNKIVIKNNMVSPMRIKMNNIDEQTSAYISNIVIRNGEWGYAGLNGNSCTFPNFYVSNLLMSGNDIEYDETGFPLSFSLMSIAYGLNCYMTNCTFACNSADIPEVSGAIILGDECNLEIYNSIVYDNEVSYSILNAGSIPGHYLKVENCLIENGINGIYGVNSTNELIWDYEDNLNCDPQFVGAGNHPQSLCENSPCVDAGTLDLPDGLELPETDIAGNLRIWGHGIDMGAYEYNPFSHPISEDVIAYDNELFVYPNPFYFAESRSNQVTILWSGDMSDTEMEFEIFNIKGQRIREWKIDHPSLYSGSTRNEKLKINSVVWDGTNQAGEAVSSGVYFVRVKIGDEYQAQRKITVTK